MANNGRLKIPWSLARQIIVRDGGFLQPVCSCRHCGRPLPLNHITFDHIVPLNKGGKNNLDNIIVSCHKCNQAKGDEIRPPEFPVALTYVELIEAFQHLPNIRLGEFDD